jgi:hypothetical protein
LIILPNVKDEPRDERRAQTEKGGLIALALVSGSAWEGVAHSAGPLLSSQPMSRRYNGDGHRAC